MKIILLGEPVSTNHVYKRHGYVIYMSAEGRALKESYQMQALSQRGGHRANDSKYQVDIKLYFKDHRQRDIDNYGKILLDSLTGIIWNNDKQVNKMCVEKFIDKQEPRIEVDIYEKHN